MASRSAKSNDTPAHYVIGFVRSAAGIALLVHALLLTEHGYRMLGSLPAPHTIHTLRGVIALEIVIGLVLAADLIFRLACVAAAAVLLCVMVVVLIGEKLGVSEDARRYPVALFLICLTGMFTGIGEFQLLDYLRELRAEPTARA